MTTPVPVHTYVQYKDKGVYQITDAFKLPEELSSGSQDGYGYDLWPAGMLRRWGNRGWSYHCVRRQSFQPLGLANPYRIVVE